MWGIKGKKPLYIDLGAEKGDHPLNFTCANSSGEHLPLYKKNSRSIFFLGAHFIAGEARQSEG